MRKVNQFGYMHPFILFMMSAFIFSCAAVGVRESPFRAGWSATTMPGWQLGSGGMSIHAVLGYARVNFQGGGGHNNFIQAGPQLRWNGKDVSANGIWAGAEFTYMNVSSKPDGNSSFSPSGSGFTVGPAVGYRFHLGKAPLSVYLAPAFLHRGTLKDDNMIAIPSSNGFYGRLGIDLHFMSLLSDKGR